MPRARPPRALLVVGALVLVVVLGDRAVAAAAGWYAVRQAGCPGLGVHVDSLPTGTPAVWQLVRGHSGRLEVGGEEVRAAGITADLDVALADVGLRSGTVGRLDGTVRLAWSELSAYVQRTEPLAATTDLSLSGTDDGSVAVAMEVPVVLVTVPVRLVAALDVAGDAVTVQVRDLSVAGIDAGVLPDGARRQLLDLASRTWPVDLPPGVEVTGLRTDAAGVTLTVAGTGLSRADLEGAGVCDG